MTVMSAFGNHVFNLTTINAHEFVAGISYVRSSTTFRINYAGGDFDVFSGTGFSYNAQGYPISGVVSSFSRYDNAALAFKIAGTHGLDGVDIAAVSRTVSTADDQVLLRSLLAGADVLTGANLGDVINGYGGNDEITGGRARDILAGGAGADDFNYRSTAESARGATTRDRITDFQASVDDIDVSIIDANGAAAGNAFSYIGTAAFSGHAGQLHWYHSGANTYVEGDTNGDRVADIQIELAGLKTLTAGDFIL